MQEGAAAQESWSRRPTATRVLRTRAGPLGELTVAVSDRALATVRTGRGLHPARAARRALSSLCATAVRHDALGHNPVRDSRPIRCARRRVRALTASEAADLQARLRQDPAAVRLDLPDLVQFMPGTGVSIGEAAAVRDAVLDHDTGTVHINATVVRVHGAGLQIQPRPKTLASERILALPAPVLAMIAARRAQGRPTRPLRCRVASPAGQLRDPSNTQADLRAALDRIGYPWVTSHVFRKTVAPRLDAAGFSIRHIADHLGHARPSTTLDRYLGRRAVTTADLADALTDLASAAPPARVLTGAVLSAGAPPVRAEEYVVRSRSFWFADGTGAGNSAGGVGLQGSEP